MRRSRAAVVALLAAACFVGPWRSREPPRSQRRCVSWLEPLDPNLKEMEPSEDAVVLPVFPLGGPFMPFSQQRLNIFEPRYRALYNDILLSGSRRFVVTSVDPNSQEHLRLATCGVVFYLEELQEVSEKTQDQIKYVCEHKVIGRVRLKRVLNPQSWFDGSTYLRAETEAIEDTDSEVDAWQLEGEVMDTMRKLEPLYNDLQRPCWRPEVLNSLNSSRAEANGLWSISEMWVQLLDAHLRVAQSEVEGKMQETVRPYAKGDSVRISDLPESAQKQIEMLRNDFTEQAKGMVMRKLEFAQKMIQTDSHQGRLEYFKSILDDEYFTSIAKKSLKNLGE